MKNLKLYFISEEYIKFLRESDKRVAYNKNTKRPYLGVVYTLNGKNYFAPLHSPKEKHKKISHKALDIFKIKDGELGVVNINNMIPTPMKVLTEAIPTVKDIKYKKLLEEQLTYLNHNKKELFSKISFFYKLYLDGNLPERVLERTCDFSLLEDKLANYEKGH